jgi:dTDP-4-amino-4,6-dideoxygalactose transaminase
MITTNDQELYNKLLLLRTHGITKDPFMLKENDGGWYYEMQTLGYNYRLTDFQAALGLSQLLRANDGLKRRHEIAARYNEAFKNQDFILAQSGVVEGHAYHLYIILVKERKSLYDFLRSKNIFCQVHYIPVHMLPYYINLGCKKGSFPVAEKYYEQCLSLPMYPGLTNDEQQYVITQIFELYNG